MLGAGARVAGGLTGAAAGGPPACGADEDVLAGVVVDEDVLADVVAGGDVLGSAAGEA